MQKLWLHTVLLAARPQARGLDGQNLLSDVINMRLEQLDAGCNGAWYL